MKILITGASGMLAQAVRKKFAQDAENEIILTDISGQKVGGEEVQSNGNTEVESLFLDITDSDAIKNVFNEIRPELVINCAAYTAVDKAETQEELAYKINADGPGNLARACKEIDATLVHVSTDYVFGGKKPVSEDYVEDDEKSPETAYGRTKLAGEEQIVESGCKYYIFRTAWLYGQGGKNFVGTMLMLGRATTAPGYETTITVVNDQYGSPTYAEDLTNIIYQAATKHVPYGIYNATDLGYTTWAGFAEKIFELADINCIVKGISSAEYEAMAKAKSGDDYKVAKRPFNSKMSKQKLLDAGVEVPTWEDGLSHYLEVENNKKGNHEE